MVHDLTRGRITSSLLRFALPMMAGNLLQQLYNIADTLIVGRVLGEEALAAVGSAYTLMTFLTSIFLGLSMGAGAFFSICRGEKNEPRLRAGIWHACVLIAILTLLVGAAVYLWLDPILHALRVPPEVLPGMREYLRIIFAGILATSVYNFFACLLRALGNSASPLWFLGISALLNVGLDLLFVAVLPFGIAGAAAATVIAQYVAAVGIVLYTTLRCRDLFPAAAERKFSPEVLRGITRLSALTCLQQSVMNFGILMVQGLVNSFGPSVMAAFAAAVKIDSFAYLPAQDFGNAYSTFVAQNHGARAGDRIRRGTRQAFLVSALYCAVVSALIFIFAAPLMHIFIDPAEAGAAAVIAAGVGYLRIEGACYVGIGFLFLFYGYYRAVDRAGMSVVLTVVSLGLRVLLAYLLSATALREVGIWLSIPIGWVVADAVGLICMRKRRA